MEIPPDSATLTEHLVLDSDLDVDDDDEFPPGETADQTHLAETLGKNAAIVRATNASCTGANARAYGDADGVEVHEEWNVAEVIDCRETEFYGI